MKRLFAALISALLPAALIAGCSAPGAMNVPPPNLAAVSSTSSSNPELAEFTSRARANGPLTIPAQGTRLSKDWGVRVPERLYSTLEKMASRSIPRQSHDGASVVVFLAVPARTSGHHVSGRETRGFSPCTLTVVGWDYGDYWEYSYSYLSGDCSFDSGAPPGGNGDLSNYPVQPAAQDIPNCPMPSGAGGTIAGGAINNSAVLKNLTTFLANNRNSPKITINKTDLPTNGPDGVDGRAAYSNTPANGEITLYTKGIAASGHPVEQVLYHELLHYYFAYAQFDFGGPNATPVLPQKGTETARINGVTYAFDLSDHSQGGGYQSFEHLLVHNALVSAFGSDLTGALKEALSKTSPPITDAQKNTIVGTAGAQTVDADIKATIPEKQDCGVTRYPHDRARLARRHDRWTSDLISDMAGITFDSTFVRGPSPLPTPPPDGPCWADSYGYCVVSQSDHTGDRYLPCFANNGDYEYDIWNSAIPTQVTAYHYRWVDISGDGSCSMNQAWDSPGSPYQATGDPYLPQ